MAKATVYIIGWDKAGPVKVIHEAEGTVERWRPHPNVLLRRHAQLKGRSAVSQLHNTVKVNEERENAAVEMRKWQRKQYSSG